jgi:hypothetical protein
VLTPRKFPLQIVKCAPSSFDSEAWLFEIKHDGFRVLAIRDDGPPLLYTRNCYDYQPSASTHHRRIGQLGRTRADFRATIPANFGGWDLLAKSAVLEKKLLCLQVERMDSHKAECIGSRA